MNDLLKELSEIRARIAEYHRADTEWDYTPTGSARENEIAAFMEKVHELFPFDIDTLLNIVDALLAENARLRRHQIAPSDTVNAAHGE
jgi:hypothetical protein